MYELVCADGFQLLGPDEIYVLDLVPVACGLAATASDQRLLLFDPLRLGQGPVSTLHTDNGALKCARALDASKSMICTSGDNGTISVWDPRLNPESAQVGRFQGV